MNSTLVTDYLEDTEGTVRVPVTELGSKDQAVYSSGAALELASDLVAGDTVYTKGRFDTGDGGEGTYVISSTRDAWYSLELTSGLFANPVLSSTVNFRQLGLQDGDDISDYYKEVPNLAGKTVQVPEGNYILPSTGNLCLFKDRGVYTIEHLGKVGVECYSDEITRDPYLTFASETTAADGYGMPLPWKWGIKLASGTGIGTKVVELSEDPPEWLQAGDLISLGNTRSLQAESRSQYTEGETLVVQKVEGRTITVASPVTFDYGVDKVYTGTVTGTSSREGSRSSTVQRVPVEFDDSSILTDSGNFHCSTLFSGDSTPRWPYHYEDSTSSLVFHYNTIRLPDKGETFTTQLNSYAIFRKSVKLVIKGDVEFNLNTDKCSTEANNSGHNGLSLVGLDAPEVSGATLRKFGITALDFSGCMSPQLRNTILDGTFGQKFKTFRWGIGVSSCTDALIEGNKIYTYSQGIDVNGTRYTSIRTVIRGNKYWGGGELYDGTKVFPDAPPQQSPIGDTSSSFCVSHGGSYGLVVEDNDIYNAAYPLGLFRGREEAVINNRAYGACVRVVGAGVNAGIRIENNAYYPSTVTGAVNEDYGNTSYIPDYFASFTVTSSTLVLPQYYPTIIKNNYAGAVRNEFLRVLAVTIPAEQGRAVAKKVTWGNNIVGRFYGVSEDGTNLGSAGMLRTTNGAIVHTSNCVYLGGDRVLDEQDLVKYDEFYYLDINEFGPAPNNYMWVGPNSVMVYLNNESATQLVLPQMTQKALTLTCSKRVKSGHYVYGVTLISGTATTYGGQHSSDVAFSASPLEGSTGEAGKLNFYYQGNSLPSNPSVVPSLWVENRTGDILKLQLQLN